MKTLLTIFVAAPAVPLAAQWLNYPTSGVPQTADGKPDLSGVWTGITSRPAL